MKAIQLEISFATAGHKTCNVTTRLRLSVHGHPRARCPDNIKIYPHHLRLPEKSIHHAALPVMPWIASPRSATAGTAGITSGADRGARGSRCRHPLQSRRTAMQLALSAWSAGGSAGGHLRVAALCAGRRPSGRRPGAGECRGRGGRGAGGLCADAGRRSPAARLCRVADWWAHPPAAVPPAVTCDSKPETLRLIYDTRGAAVPGAEAGSTALAVGLVYHVMPFRYIAACILLPPRWHIPAAYRYSHTHAHLLCSVQSDELFSITCL